VRFHRVRLAAVSASMALLFVGLLYANVPDIRVGAFSESTIGKGLPEDWNPWILKNVKHRSVYTVVRDDSPVIKAVADNSASGLMKNISVDPREHPVLRWRWKVAGTIEGADVARKENNDSPARVYVAFAYDINRVGFMERLKYRAAKRIYSDSLPLRAISYTWGNKTAKDAIVPMPYTQWFSQIVLENAASPTGQWISEERDVFEDYRKAFGEEPGQITGVAIMTNTDNMGGRATAWYGDIVFKEKS
jgi:hypothetical protein